MNKVKNKIFVDQKLSVTPGPLYESDYPLYTDQYTVASYNYICISTNAC